MAECATHRVTVQRPGQALVTVLCGIGHRYSGPECLQVVERYQDRAVEGTEIFVEERSKHGFVPRVLWFRARGRWHRQFLDPVDGSLTVTREAITRSDRRRSPQATTMVRNRRRKVL